MILAGLEQLFVPGALCEVAERPRSGMVDAKNANYIFIDAEDDAVRGVEELVEREAEVVLFGDSWATGR